MRHHYDSEAKIGFIAPVVDIRRKEHIPQAGWAAGDHGDVWMFCSCGVCQLQVSNEDHPVCWVYNSTFV